MKKTVTRSFATPRLPQLVCRIAGWTACRVCSRVRVRIRVRVREAVAYHLTKPCMHHPADTRSLRSLPPKAPPPLRPVTVLVRPLLTAVPSTPPLECGCSAHCSNYVLAITVTLCGAALCCALVCMRFGCLRFGYRWRRRRGAEQSLRARADAALEALPSYCFHRRTVPSSADHTQCGWAATAGNERACNHAGRHSSVGNAEDVESSAANLCAICLQDFVRREMVTSLPCAHEFHAECIQRWMHARLNGALLCPLCKRTIIVNVNCNHGASGNHGGAGRDLARIAPDSPR